MSVNTKVTVPVGSVDTGDRNQASVVPVNRLAAETSPYLLQHAGNPVDWYPWGPEALERARREERPILLSVGYSACHWCHVMAHESFESPATAALMNEHFVNVKVDREERPDVDALYMDATVTMTGQGGWPMTVFLTPDGRAVLCRDVLPPGAAPRHAVVLPAPARRGGGLADAARRHRRAGPAARRFRQPLGPPAAVVRPAHGRRCSRRRSGGSRARSSPCYGGFGRAPKFPPASTLEFLLRRGSPEAMAMVRDDARRHGGGRDVRPRRRRLPPLLGRRPLARAAFREDALRQRAPRRRVPACLGRDGGGALSRRRRGDARLRAARAPPARRRPRLRAGRRHERRRGAHVHVDRGGGRARPSCSSPFEHGRSIIRGELDAGSARAAARRARAAPAARARRQGARLVERPRARRARRGRAPARALRLARGGRRASPEFLLGPLSREDGRLSRSWRDGQGERRGLPRRLRERRARPPRAPRRDAATSAGCTRLAASPCSPSSSSTTPSTAASSSRRPGARSSSRARRASTTTRSRPATRCSRTCSCGSGGSGGTTSSSGSAAPSCGSSRRCSAAPRARSAGRSARSTSSSHRRARSPSRGRSTARSPAPRWRRSRRTRSSRSVPPTACRCSRARAWSTGSRRSTCASASPAGRR